MRYLSVCSGIEAASVAWEPLKWEAAGFAEIEPFPCAVLQHHYPKVKNYGDFTKIGKDDVGAIDLLVGGTPCQDFSVAGLRAGLAGDRGALTIEFLHLAERLRPRWLVWENVPGVLSSDGGRAFGAYLGLLGELGYGFAYRVLDAQYFGLAQRRRRVFVVGCLGDWRRAAAVLFESHSLSGSPAPRRKKRKGATLGIEIGSGGGCVTEVSPTLDTGCGDGFIRNQKGVGAMSASKFGSAVAGTLMASGAGMERPAGRAGETDFLVAHYDDDGFHYHRQKVAHPLSKQLRSSGVTEDGIERGDSIVTAFTCKDDGSDATNDISPTLRSMHHADGGQPNGGGQVAIAFGGQSDPISSIECAQPVTARNGQPGSVAAGSTVRRLTPVECERLQGFPDDWTLVPYRGKPASDGPRYRSLGNSFAVPVVRWIGERIAMVSSMERDV